MTMRSPAIVDSSALLAALDASQRSHRECAAILRGHELDLVVPTMVIAEVAYFVDQRLGSRAEAAFIRSVAGMEIEAPLPDEWAVIAEMAQRYATLRLGATDAATAVLAERLGTDLIITLDRRHFGAIRSSGGRPFRLLPEPPALHEAPAAYGVAAGAAPGPV